MDGQSDSLAGQVTKRLENDGDLATQQAGTSIGLQLDGPAKTLWADGHVSVSDLWQTYAQYPYMPRLVDSGVLRDGLRQAPVLWQEEGYALATSFDAENERYIGLIVPTDPQWGGPVSEQDLIVRPEVAVTQREAEAKDDKPVDPDHPGENGAQGEGDTLSLIHI